MELAETRGHQIFRRYAQRNHVANNRHGPGDGQFPVGGKHAGGDGPAVRVAVDAQHPRQVVRNIGCYFVQGIYQLSYLTQSSRTQFRPVETFRGFTLVEVAPETGRTHQIRVHFAAVRHPLVGDRLYGGERNIHPREERLRERLRAFRRPALHAWELAFPHPDDDRRVCYRAEPPADFQLLLEELRRREADR